MEQRGDSWSQGLCPSEGTGQQSLGVRPHPTEGSSPTFFRERPRSPWCRLFNVFLFSSAFIALQLQWGWGTEPEFYQYKALPEVEIKRLRNNVLLVVTGVTAR